MAESEMVSWRDIASVAALRRTNKDIIGMPVIG